MLRFIITAECSSLTKASNLLFVSTSPLSRSITSLEDHLDSKLFIRKCHGLALTDKGKWLYNEIKPIFNRLKSIEECMKQNTYQSKCKVDRSFASVGLLSINYNHDMVFKESQDSGYKYNNLSYSYCHSITLLMNREHKKQVNI
ncbi:LysR family transcriptional regulator [Yokenella regensburgei]|uniref:LysR family transcriptional regulator n=1 Tax=Yokenella regensburgei TaxID=158877 RepID=UPI003ED9C648